MSVSVQSAECTIFVATRVGQIRNELNFIEQFNPACPRLLIMTPKRDKTLRTNLINMARVDVFDQFKVAILPNYPASPYGFRRRTKIYNVIFESLKELIGDSTKVNLFLHHANRYYVYFERILAELGIDDYTLNILEEGLASYAWGNPDLEDTSLVAPGYSPKEAAQRVWKEVKFFIEPFISIFKHIFKLFLGLVEFVVAVLGRITGVNFFDAFIRFLRHFQKKKYHFGYVTHFDDGYFYFPNKMANTSVFTIDHLHPLILDVDLDKEDEMEMDEETIDAADVVFASQKYGSPVIYYEIILTILEEMGVSAVFFKLHPREDFIKIKPYLMKASINHPSVKIIHDENIDAIPLETLLVEHNYKQVIGLTTSTLMYVPLLGVETKPISISDHFFELYSKLDPTGQQGTGTSMQAFLKDRKIFNAIAPEVEQFHPVFVDGEEEICGKA